MWNRKELKAKGKAAFYANRVTCIIAALLLAIAGGIGGGYVAPTTTGTSSNSNNQVYKIEDGTAYDYENSVSEDVWTDYEGENSLVEEDGTLPMLNILKIFLAVLAVALVLVIILSIILLNPLNVAMRKFFIDNAADAETGINKSNLGMGFGENWKNIVGAMFVTDLFVLLWSLLLVIPGIYKTYCWRMVPFIISENPNMSGEEARKESARMMNGSKWQAFVLDLSFLGWRLLAVFTLGILNLLFTNPYQACTEAELYLALKDRKVVVEVSDDIQPA